MKYKHFLLLLLLIVTLTGFRRTVKEVLYFKTSKGQIIKVIKGDVFFDNKRTGKIKDDDGILYGSKLNRLIEDHGSLFLFIAIAGNPGQDRLFAFSITPTSLTLVADAILSPIKDYDGDGYLEFGGRDLTEMHPSRDSMYYIPTAYYEIKQGKIHHDYSLTKTEDTKLNGMYLSSNNRLDKNGNCCKVVPTPGRKHRHHVQPQSDHLLNHPLGQIR